MIQVFALVVFALGLAAFVLKPHWSLVFLMALSVFGAAGTVILPGGASIQPANLYLIFLVARIVLTPGLPKWMFEAIRPGNRGFWLLLLTAVGIVSAIFYPRLFAGLTDVYAIDRSTGSGAVKLVPLRPTSGNITQTIYLIGGLVTFAAAYALTRIGAGTRGYLTGLFVLATLNLVMAFLDLTTAAAGVGFLLDFVRSGGYAMLNEHQIGSLKRIVGSFPEASQFAAYTSPVLLALVVLWWVGVRRRLSAILAVCTLVAIVLSTSSTGYLALAAFALGAMALFAVQTMGGRIARKSIVIMTAGAFVLAGVGLMIATNRVPNQAVVIVNSTLVGKAESDSGQERSSWNRQGLENFADTYGMGVGLGSARASSFVVSLLSGLGLPGLICFLGFLGSMFVGRPASAWPEDRAVMASAAAMTVGTVIAASISSGVFDLGSIFFVSTGVLAATIEKARRPVAMTWRHGAGAELPGIGLRAEP